MQRAFTNEKNSTIAGFLSDIFQMHTEICDAGVVAVMVDILLGCHVASVLGYTSLRSVPRGTSAHSMVSDALFLQ